MYIRPTLTFSRRGPGPTLRESLFDIGVELAEMKILVGRLPGLGCPSRREGKTFCHDRRIEEDLGFVDPKFPVGIGAVGAPNRNRRTPITPLKPDEPRRRSRPAWHGAAGARRRVTDLGAEALQLLPLLLGGRPKAVDPRAQIVDRLLLRVDLVLQALVLFDELPDLLRDPRRPGSPQPVVCPRTKVPGASRAAHEPKADRKCRTDLPRGGKDNCSPSVIMLSAF